jgi:thiosulfate dehydrogenase [quinone] large subunit
MDKRTRVFLALVRIALGWLFLWAFVDKLFGLGFATTPDKSWLAGGSPTYGFLNSAAHGPLSGLYKSIAGAPVVDVLFMFGLLGLGLALILGIGMKVVGVAGPLLMLLLWSARIPPESNPILDEHIIYGLTMIALSAARAGQTLGLGKWWAERVKRVPILE